MTKQIVVLVIFIFLCLAIGFIGSFATRPNIEGWYNDLVKPSWTPPDSVFGPVWTVLYIMMAAAAWIVWRKTGNFISTPMLVFILQLILNLAWSWLFFGMRNPLAGLIDIVILWIAILITVVTFWKVYSLAGILLLPYLIWVTFASALNFSIWRMN